MSGDANQKARKDGFSCGYSLAKAIFDAGGNIDLERLSCMTLEEFICTVAAQNGIMFVYVPQDRQPERPRKVHDVDYKDQ